MAEKMEQKTKGRASYPENLRFETIAEARESLAKLTIGYIEGTVSEHSLRCATYAINGLGKLLAHEKLAKYEARLAALEKRQNS